MPEEVFMAEVTREVPTQTVTVKIIRFMDGGQLPTATETISGNKPKQFIQVAATPADAVLKVSTISFTSKC